MRKAVLKIENLTKAFEGNRRFFFFKSKQPPFIAIENVSFELKEGEILGILGANGAGKTTIIQMLLGTLTPTSGNILYFGKPFTNQVLQAISHASAYHKLPISLTIQENLEIFGRLYGLSIKEARKGIEYWLQKFGLLAFRNKPADSISAGQMTRVMLVKAFLTEPGIILLDEPTASLDPDIAFETRDIIMKQQKEFGVSIILTSHNMKEVAEMCNRVLVLQKGKIIQEDTPQNLAESIALSEVTLTISEHIDKAVESVEAMEWHYKLFDGHITIELQETDISKLLRRFAQLNIEYSSIQIEKPTLEDYFLHINKRVET